MYNERSDPPEFIKMVITLLVINNFSFKLAPLFSVHMYRAFYLCYKLCIDENFQQSLFLEKFTIEIAHMQLCWLQVAIIYAIILPIINNNNIMFIIMLCIFTIFHYFEQLHTSLLLNNLDFCL